MSVEATISVDGIVIQVIRIHTNEISVRIQIREISQPRPYELGQEILKFVAVRPNSAAQTTQPNTHIVLTVLTVPLIVLIKVFLICIKKNDQEVEVEVMKIDSSEGRRVGVGVEAEFQIAKKAGVEAGARAEVGPR